MQGSWDQVRVDAAWSTLKAATADGFTSSSVTSLGDVTAARDSSYDAPDSDYDDQTFTRRDGNPVTVVRAEGPDSSRYWRVEHHLDVSVDALSSTATADTVRSWAAECRTFERDLVLLDLVQAPEHDVAVTELDPATLDGSGSGYLVVWGPKPPLISDGLRRRFDHVVTIEDGILDLTNNPLGRCGVAFRSDGGPVVQRGEDLTLDWLPSPRPKVVTLVAHQRLRVARASHVTALTAT